MILGNFLYLYTLYNMLRIGYIAAIILIINVLKAQVSAPQLHCVSVGSGGNVALTWIPPNDPSAQFFSYEIFHSALSGGPFVPVGTVTPNGTNTFTHAITTATIQSQYYFVRTRFGATGASFSTNSDTLRSIFLWIFAMWRDLRKFSRIRKG